MKSKFINLLRKRSDSMDYNEIEKNFHQYFGDLFLTQNQVDILNKYNIDYTKFNNLNELIYYLEEYLNNKDNEELDLLSEEIAEYNYYHNTNK